MVVLCQRVCIEFCEKTRNDIDGLLSQYDPPDSVPAELLVRQLNKTLVFETEMVARFEKARPTKAGARGGAGAGHTVMVDDDGEEIDPSSAEGVRRRYRERADTVGAICRDPMVASAARVVCECCPAVLTNGRWQCGWFEQESARKAEEEASVGETARTKWLASLAKGGAGGGTTQPAHVCVVGDEFSASLCFGVLLPVPTIPKDTAQLKSVARVISSCFDPYMGAYVKFERK